MVNLLRLGPFQHVTAANQSSRSPTSSPFLAAGRKYMVPNTGDAPGSLDATLGAIPELSFMSQITCRLFENRDMPLDHDDRVSVHEVSPPPSLTLLP